jgi:hypothetical protein
MTLISMINGYGRTLIISDRAISEKGTLNTVLLSTTNSETIVPTAVVDFNVKSLIIQDILCVTFCGNLAILEEIHRDVTDFFLFRKVTTATLNEFLTSNEYGPGSSLLFAMGGPEFPDQLFVLKVGDWIHEQNHEKIDVLSCGSGAADWTSYLIQQLSYHSDDDHSDESTLQMILSACMAFLTLERKSTVNLRNGWGGGFDIVRFQDGKFHRFNDITYIFYKYDFTMPGQPGVLSLIHNSYINGDVIVRHLTEAGFEIYHIPQLNNRIPFAEMDPNCSSKNVISCVHLFKGQEFYSDLRVMFWDTNPEAESAIFTTRENGMFGVRFRDEYIKQIKKAINLFLN